MQKLTSSLAILLLLSLTWTVPVVAQDEAGETVREQVDAQLMEYQERLDLDDYTWSQVHLILKSNVKERLAIAQRYGLDGQGEAYDQLSGKEKRQMRGELKENRKATTDRMERYLTKDQMKVFKEIQEEHRDQMRELMGEA